MRFFRDPLIHFLIAGALLFVLYDIFSPAADGDGTDPRTIQVNQDTILNFIQYRTKTFDPDQAMARWVSLKPEQRQTIIDDYIREESLYREAIAFGLEDGDYVIRQRLVQKIDFIAKGTADAAPQPTPDEIDAFFAASKDAYQSAPYVTFTHVFFDAEKRGLDGAKKAAESKKSELTTAKATFTDAPKHGDRFAYHLNYVEQEPDVVASHFGASMAAQLFALGPDDQKWQGPFQSPYGEHLILLVDKAEARDPHLEEVMDRVIQDLTHQLARTRQDESIADIVDRYEIEIAPSLLTGTAIKP